MAKATTRKAPWKRPNPRKRTGKASEHLTPAKKAAAKARARRAGRPYPNLEIAAKGERLLARYRKAKKRA